MALARRPRVVGDLPLFADLVRARQQHRHSGLFCVRIQPHIHDILLGGRDRLLLCVALGYEFVYATGAYSTTDANTSQSAHVF